jgi:hypothetical protein
MSRTLMTYGELEEGWRVVAVARGIDGEGAERVPARPQSVGTGRATGPEPVAVQLATEGAGLVRNEDKGDRSP